MTTYTTNGIQPKDTEVEVQAAIRRLVDFASVYIEYAEFVAKKAKPMELKDSLCHGALGVCGEAGELADAIKKHWAYNKELDVANVIEELGDLTFYMQLIMNELNITWEEVIQGNIDKLNRRYKEKYSNEEAINRADKKGVL